MMGSLESILVLNSRIERLIKPNLKDTLYLRKIILNIKYNNYYVKRMNKFIYYLKIINFIIKAKIQR